MEKLSPQTKSFILIFSLAVVGAYLCLILWSDLAPTLQNYGYNNYYHLGRVRNFAANLQLTQMQQNEPAPIDTSAWKTYANPDYDFSFQYKPDWKVTSITSKNGYKILQIDPGKKYYNIKIYISPEDFYIMGGLPLKQEAIDGQTALNCNNALYGIKVNGNYFTFDVGLSMSLVPDFDALVHSVKFASAN